MKKILLGLIIGILLQKTLTSANWYSFNYFSKECVKERREKGYVSEFWMNTECIYKKQGIFRYLFISSGTIAPEGIGYDSIRWVY